MHDLPTFVQELKLRFSTWYNRRQGREGPLWTERYQSALVEPDNRVALREVAVFVEGAPVRVGAAAGPVEYPFCSAGAAACGDGDALAAVERVRRGLRGSPI